MNVAGLLALQLLDSELDQIEQRRKRLPERAAVAEATAAHAAWATERAAQVARGEAAQRSIEESEEAGAELDRKTAKLQAQLKTVIAPREAEALMKEIEGLAARHRELDDVELAAMEEQAAADDEIARLDGTGPALADALAAATAALDAASQALDAERADATARRAEAAAALDASELGLYDRTRAQHGGVGFARLERHTCTACHVDLSQVEYERVMATPAGELAECPHCARSLVV